MSMTIPKTETTVTEKVLQAVHYKILGRTRFRCIQPECDGRHHVYCSCGH